MPRGPRALAARAGAGDRPFRGRPAEAHFPRVPAPVPLFTPVRASFPCPALLSAAGRAALGGARETLLGAVMAVRLIHAASPPHALDAETREARAEAARTWLAALTLPAKVRTALHRAFATSATGDPASAADALEAVTEVTTAHLDRGARAELVRLVTVLRTAAAQLAEGHERPIE